MKQHPRTQRGATLVVGLIMLLLITLMVSSAFTLSGTNLKAVGNMQFRDEAIAAANMGIEQVMSSAFTSAPTAESIAVDINDDGTTDYLVAIAQPLCLRESVAGASAPSSASLAGLSSSTWNTVWSLDSTVTDSVSGTAVHVRSGVRVLLSDAQKNTVCP